MANLTSSSIADGSTIEASHITALYDVLTGAATYDNISVAGTSSNATSAVSASYASNATSASYAVTSSNATSAVSASYAVTASYATNAGGATINTGSFYVSSSVVGATITFKQGDNTTEAVTVNNVTNATSASYATTASYVKNAVSSSHAVTASYALNAGGGTGDAITDGTKTLDFDGSSNLQSNTTFLPTANSTYDLGSAEQKWRHLYLSANSLYMSGSGGWMTGSWDGTNLRINNNALIKSSVTSSMSVASAATSVLTLTTQVEFDSNRGGTNTAPFATIAGKGTLVSGNALITTFSGPLQDKILGEDCFITATAMGNISGSLRVSLDSGNIQVDDDGGASGADFNFIGFYAQG